MVSIEEKLLSRMRLLTPSQFEEVLYIFFPGGSSHIRQGVTPNQQAIDALNLIRQERGGLVRLQNLLDELDRFKEFLPKGAYPVGQKLREREEARERQDMEEAEARGEDPEDYRVTPEKFYTFKPEADWLGIFRGWDAPRSFHSELLQQVVDASRSRNNGPAAAIIGHSGSGKSVALRRLAVDLAEQGYKVWWVKHPEQLLQFGMSEIADSGDGPQFLLVDNVHRIDDGYVESFNEYLQDNRSLTLVVAGRRLPNAFKVQVGAGSSLFNPYEADDRDWVLGKIAETIPEWADTAKKLKAEPLRKVRLIRLLVVMARRKAAPRNLEELETVFLKIIADDISTIHATLPGLADAVIDAAAIREVSRDISRETFIALADYRQPGASVPLLLEDVSGNQRWKGLESLVSHDPEYDTVQFHHDELVEGIISAGQRDFLESRIIDDAWRREVLDVVIDRGSAYSSSYALSGFIRNHPGIISQEPALVYLHKLLDAGNGHHAYLTLIVDEALDLEQQERVDLLCTAARVTPLNARLWSTVWGWIQRNYQMKEARCEILEQLYQEGCRGQNILIPLLQQLPHEKACVVAKRLLAESKYPQVLCTCLNLLGDEVQSDAKRLLTDKTTHPSVLATCLNLLGDEVKSDAKRLLETSDDHEVLCTCIKLLGEGAKSSAKRLLADTTTHPFVLVTCLNLLGDEVKSDAKSLLETSDDHEVLCTCIKLLGDEAKDDTKRLLKESKDQEVLCTCLKLLGDGAKDDAKRLLTESNDPEVLATCLKLLDDKDRNDAKRLLTESNDPKVQCACVKLLGEGAKPFAVERIRCWTETDPALLVRCFQVAGATPEGGKAAAEMLAAWNKRVPPILRAVTLRVPFDTPLRIQRAYEVLHNWRGEYRQLVAAALTAFWDDPDAVTEYCIAILRRWHPEILYRHKHNRIAYDGHIIKALSHPALKDDACYIARKMLGTEARSPGFLSPELRRQAENIIRGEGPIWSSSEEETG